MGVLRQPDTIKQSAEIIHPMTGNQGDMMRHATMTGFIKPCVNIDSIDRYLA